MALEVVDSWLKGEDIHIGKKGVIFRSLFVNLK